MVADAPSSLSILRRLVAYPTISSETNIPLIDFVEGYLDSWGASSTRVTTSDGKKANLFATVGPVDAAGILLSGHTDVVPVADQSWSSDPFVLKIDGGRAIGRGAVDMKGFVACALRLVALASRSALKRPLHIALSHDEEIGCVGVRPMLPPLKDAIRPPALCVIGEPTNMAVVVAHKGKFMGRFVCHGVPGHSSDPNSGVNAITMASDAIGALARMQKSLRNAASADDAYLVPYTTVHVGTIVGGTSLNVIPSRCEFEFEVRNVPGDDQRQLIGMIESAAGAIAQSYGAADRAARIDVEILNSYPSLSADPDCEAADLLRKFTHANGPSKVSFGTEAGLFAQELGVPTYVCGPGDVAMAHKADEFIMISQLDSCDAFLEGLLGRLCLSEIGALETDAV